MGKFVHSSDIFVRSIKACLLIVLLCASVSFCFSCVPGVPKTERQLMLEAEEAVLTNCSVINRDDVGASGDACVGYLEVGSEISWKVLAAEDEAVTMIFGISCPTAWIGVHNLPQTFDFDGLYTLIVNGKITKTGVRCLGSSDVQNHNNWYYWTEVQVDAAFTAGENTITLLVSNTYGRDYCFGNVDRVTIYSDCELEDVTSAEAAA